MHKIIRQACEMLRVNARVVVLAIIALMTIAFVCLFVDVIVIDFIGR